MPGVETEDTKESIEELSIIFSNANFLCEVENRDNQAVDEDEIDLNIGKPVLGIVILYIEGDTSCLQPITSNRLSFHMLMLVRTGQLHAQA